MITPVELILACLLDLVIGDPRWLPHPVQMIGVGISGMESVLRKCIRSPQGEKWAGIVLAALIVLPVYFITLFIYRTLSGLSAAIPSVIGNALIIYLVSSTIAVRGLLSAARQVIDSVRIGNIETARHNLGMIVGRDTEDLTDKGVLKATMESLAENLSDGIIAPLFFLALGGLPLAMAYKAINTLDSMVGYRNERYINFGHASARLDDAANYLPARITGLLVVVSSVFVLRSLPAARGSFRTMLRDGGNHLSPNSGIPEAAVAGAVGIRFGGPATYGGLTVEKPFIGDGGEEDYMAASARTLGIIKVTSILGVVTTSIFLAIRSSI